MKQSNNNGSHVGDELTFGNGSPRERWPFSRLQPGKYFEVKDMALYDAVRVAASRAGKRLKRKFAVRKETIGARAKLVIRVYSM